MISSIKDCTILNNGQKMPWFGLGLYKMMEEQELVQAVRAAMDAGYRSLDTAAFYGNERYVGTAIRRSGIPRSEIFLTTKVWNDAQREGRVLDAFEQSLDNLGTDYVDLYLVHWPVQGFLRQTWQVLEEIYTSGRARAIGTSNFLVHHLQELMEDCRVKPAVNQVEFHPRLFQRELLAFCRDQGIQLEAWRPLMKGTVAESRPIQELASKYNRTPVQITLRWLLQHQVVIIPKSSHPERIRQNAAVFDFELSAQDMEIMNALDEGFRFGPHPDKVDF